MEEIDLNALIQSVLDDTEGISAEKHLSLTAELPDQEISIYSDQRSLQKIFTQLLHNAGAVTPEGGQISISACLEHSDTEDDYALVQVADQGEGIEPQDLARVFLAREAEDQIQGIACDNGYDLSSVKALVEVLGGRTWVDSQPGQGATFSVLLPVSSALNNRNGGGGIW
jgi:two-component system clock-associated histidine kinase SasA